MAGLAYRVAVAPAAITNAPTVVIQGTNSAAVPVTIKRIEVNSSLLGATQAIIPLQFGTYATGTAGGSTPVASAEHTRNSVTATTIFKAITATMGTTFTSRYEWQWNGASPFDMVFGKDIAEPEIAAAVVWALIIPSASGTPNISCVVTFEEH